MQDGGTEERKPKVASPGGAGAENQRRDKQVEAAENGDEDKVVEVTPALVLPDGAKVYIVRTSEEWEAAREVLMTEMGISNVLGMQVLSVHLTFVHRPDTVRFLRNGRGVLGEPRAAAG